MKTILIAGAHSGVGKTSITLGLVRLLTQRGLQVQTFKVGPDYLDPGYLQIASGRPCYNLDGWMMSEEYVKSLFRRACGGADIAVIEGVMGLFDGADPASDAGSTAEIARWLEAPVVLVVSAHGMSRSLAALVHGYVHFDKRIKISGVVANRCGSQKHADFLDESLKAASLPPLVGAVERGALPELNSRHLGLVSADAERVSSKVLDDFARALSPSLKVDEILNHAKNLPETRNDFLPPTCKKTMRLGVARDEAFHFYYPDNLEALERAGCELIDFSPLKDSTLPENLQGIYLGGGYPEEFAETLSANTTMRESIHHFASEGGAIYAECGGLMYLSQGIRTLEGREYPQVGLLPAWTRMEKKRRALGYVEVTLTADSLWGKRGDHLRGHEYHYSTLEGLQDGASSWEKVYEICHRRTGEKFAEGYQQGRVLASYAHLHFASSPQAVLNLVQYFQLAGVPS